MIWWSAALKAQAGNSHHGAESCVNFCTRQVAPGDRERNAPGFVPKGEVRQPGADAKPAWGNAPTHSVASAAPEFHSRCRFPQPPTKEDPGATRGPGSIAGWVRGWGLGGTPPGAMPQRRGFHPVPTPEIIFEPCPAQVGADGASAPGAPGRPAVRRGGHPETPDIANGCEDGPARRRGPRPRSACRPGTGWGDRLQGNP